MKNISEYFLNSLLEYVKTAEEQQFIERIKASNSTELSQENYLYLQEICDQVQLLVKSLFERGRNSESANWALEVLQTLENLENGKAQLSILQVKNATWGEYCDMINNVDQSQKLSSRLELLEVAQTQLKLDVKFSQMDIETRYLFAGNGTDSACSRFGLDVAFFGSMKGAGHFIGLVNQHPEKLDDFFQNIPKTGEITRDLYISLVEQYKEAFARAGINGNYLRPFTRLLTIIRPDIFLCITSRNEKLLCEVLGESKLATHDFEGYWDKYIEAISNWKPFLDCPMNELTAIASGKIALLDALFYQDDETSVIRTMLNKPVAQLTWQEAAKRMAEFFKNNKTQYPSKIREHKDGIIQCIVDGDAPELAFSKAMALIKA